MVNLSLIINGFLLFTLFLVALALEIMLTIVVVRVWIWFIEKIF